jgi:transcriptional regulator with XRE-family HTH domain
MAWQVTPNDRSFCCNRELLATIRKSRGWTQQQLANASGYSERLIRKAEAGNSISADTIADIAEALSQPDRTIFPEDLISDPLELAKNFVKAWYTYQSKAATQVRHFLDDAFVFELVGDAAEGIPFAGRYVGFEGLNRFFELFFTYVEVPEGHDHTAHYDFFANGNDVAIVGKSWMHPIGKPLETPIDSQLHLRFQRGRLVLCRDLVDTQKGGAAIRSSLD